MRVALLTLAMCLLVPPAYAKYSGGTGEPNDPYQIATAADLIALGETPEDYNKHFLLTADIDLDPNLPGRKVFNQAIIAPARGNSSMWHFNGHAFTGSLDGQGRTIAGMVIDSDSEYAGLFGLIGDSGIVCRVHLVRGSVRGAVPWAIKPRCGTGGLAGENRGRIQDCHSNVATRGLCVVGGLVGENRGTILTSTSAGSVTGTEWVGGLVGHNNHGTISTSRSTGSVAGTDEVGGLVGYTGYNNGTISLSVSTGPVTGTSMVGGVVGHNHGDTISMSCSTGSVSGTSMVGGLAGCSSGTISNSISTGSVSGTRNVGGLVGHNSLGMISLSASTCPVTGTDREVGGLVGSDQGGTIWRCFWDMTTSGQATSAGGTGLATPQMQDAQTFLDAGWDFLGEWENGTCEFWQIPEQGGYPVLTLLNGYTPPRVQGEGTFDDPYLVETAGDLGGVWYRPGACYQLAGDIDLSGIQWSMAVIPSFSGRFDGQGRRIRGMAVSGTVNVGLFGILTEGAEVLDLGLEDTQVTGTNCVGSLAARNHGLISTSHSTGFVTGTSGVGGLVGLNYSGMVSSSYNTGSVTGTSSVGGLVGSDSSGTISMSHSAGSVSGAGYGAGGLVGYTYSGTISNSYSTSSVSGSNYVGGLVGRQHSGAISTSYSTGSVTGTDNVGGLVGVNEKSTVLSSFWDTTTSAMNLSAAGTGLPTADMQTASTFLDAGWDFMDETGNGTEDIWWIDEGKDYPRLWWELVPEN